MTDRPTRERKFNDEEVALIIKRAAELQQTEQVADEPGSSLSLVEVEQIAREAGIDPRMIRRAATSLETPSVTTRPSPWLGAPTRLVYERVVDGEIPVEEFEALVNEIRRTFGDNGIPSVLGRTLAWSSTQTAGRRRSHGRNIDVSVTTRGGVTTIRVEEELRNLATGLFAGFVAGGGGGTMGISVGIGMSLFHSAPAAGLIWVGFAGAFYTLARTIFGRISAKREKELGGLVTRLEQRVEEIVASRAPSHEPQAQLTTADSVRALPNAEGTTGVA